MVGGRISYADTVAARDEGYDDGGTDMSACGSTLGERRGYGVYRLSAVLIRYAAPGTQSESSVQQRSVHDTQAVRRLKAAQDIPQGTNAAIT